MASSPPCADAGGGWSGVSAAGSKDSGVAGLFDIAAKRVPLVAVTIDRQDPASVEAAESTIETANTVTTEAADSTTEMAAAVNACLQIFLCAFLEKGT